MLKFIKYNTMIKKTTLCIIALFAMVLSISAQDSFKRHEVSIGYGFKPTSDWVDSFSDAWGGLAGLKSKNDTSFGSLSLTYNYRLTKMFGICCVLSYSNRHKEWIDSDKGKQKMNYYTVMPRVKAEWLHGKIFTLYSSLAAGVTIYNDKFGSETESKVCFGWQVSPIGVEVGNCIAGFAELGIGQLGVCQLGVRCRF